MAEPRPDAVPDDTGCPSDLGRALELTRSLVDAIEGTSVSRLSLSCGGLQIEVERRGAAAAVPPAPVVAAPPSPPGAPDGVAPVAASGAPEPAGVAVTAPLVGVFYRRRSPEQPPLVEVGDHVEAGQPLAIVEAMKMTNEVVANVAGTVRSIHAQDHDVVEFEQVLFRLGEAS
ncbi:MAG: acetyl-CoA carboxylase biotin carboxyl carrier protein [Solirubrobacteraceae bacterium]|jgi:acetyl-CoA carboxylase biotin carboxyl carrier protein|nr:acetyl-CoA carboxylase biotin carboxyl carrier protein [Solirubrobacteraceae bacterium]